MSKTVKDTFKLMFTSLKKILLVPTLAFFALMSTFVGVELAKSYIACAYGIHSIGLYFLLYGISSSIFSISIGFVTKYVRKSFMLIFFVTSYCAFSVYFLYWDTSSHVFVIISSSIVFGCLDAIYGTCINGKIKNKF